MHDRLSIVASLADASKRYLSTVADHGYELGVGRGGDYDPHAHRAFVDVIYSPHGIEVETGDGIVRNTKLVAVQPGSPLYSIRPGNFWFIKFYPNLSATKIKPPEKYDLEEYPVVLADYLCLVDGAWRTAIWFPGVQEGGSILFELVGNGRELCVSIAGAHPTKLTVVP